MIHLSCAQKHNTQYSNVLSYNEVYYSFKACGDCNQTFFDIASRDFFFQSNSSLGVTS